MKRRLWRYSRCLLIFLVLMATPRTTPAAVNSAVELYKQIKAFNLAGSSFHLENFTLDRDALQFVLTGDIYFSEPIDGNVYGGVFIGQGAFKSEGKNVWEKASIKRFLNSGTVESTFTKAVFRFTDDTFAKFAGQPSAGSAPSEAQRMASTLEEHLIRETGLNLDARLLQAVVNNDDPGVFFAEVDGGNHGRFDCVVDHQGRVPANIFEINGGEKGLIFKYEGVNIGTDVWTAFYDAEDFQRGIATYSDAFDLIAIPNYRMEVDLRDAGHWLRIQAQLDVTSLANGVQVIPMSLNDGLSEKDNARRDKGVRVLSATMENGTALGVIQEPWDAGILLVLPQPLSKGSTARIILKMEGKDTLWSWGSRFHYPRSTSSWYPRHGYLSRSRFDMVFKHGKNDRIASIGHRVKEGPSGQGDEWVTEWTMNDPVALVTFVCGPFKRHEEIVDVSGRKIPLDYYSPPSDVQAVKEDFILAEMGNALKYYDNFFGQYPYGRLGGAFFPTNYGQGFPTLLLLPVQGTADRDEFAFLAHENAHQWWGNIVGWRSYRDQWLSEGFAEYSGVLYTAARSGAKDASELIKEMRREMTLIAQTSTGVSKMNLHEVGPLILGPRLDSSKSGGAGDLMYAKGALVLRMLHFLLSNPERTDDSAFFAMMKDFVNRHRNGMATSESFMQVASEHFARSPIGQKYGMRDLNWFLAEWVYHTGLPSYQLEYKTEPREGGGFSLKGTLVQQDVPDDWFMVLPLSVEFSGGRVARTTISATSPKTPFEIRLPEKPQKVRLDPDLWVLSGKVTEKGSQ